MCSDTILVWDDEADHLELLVYNLNRSGCPAAAIPSEDRVIADSLRQKPQLVILGNCSSEERRAELCKALKQQLPQTLILCLTTDDHCWERSYNQEAGMNACIIFPAKPKQILKVVRSLLNENKSTCCEPVPKTSSLEDLNQTP